MRYPGGKSYIAKKILPYLGEYVSEQSTFVDVFAGGLTMTVAFANAYPQVKKFWINDKDPGIAALWSSYINWKPNLKAVLRLIEPTVDLFFNYQKELAELNQVPEHPGDMITCAAKKIMIHQCSYSGLGIKGGVQGGRNQLGTDKITTNWNPDHHYKKMDEFQKLFHNSTFYNNNCTNFDFTEVIEKADESCLLYLDPPYYQMGKRLYHFYFDDNQHKRLATYLKHTPRPWVLSYDDCEEIRELYNWARIEVISNDNRMQMIESNGLRRANTKTELIIRPL